MKRIYTLTIAGTDPSSGAGIQADLKTFSALGVYGTTVITSLTAQNTCNVQSIYPIDSQFIATQMDTVLSDINISSAKIGMLERASVINVVATKLKEYTIPFIILDTVMVAKNGAILLDKNAIVTLRDILIPLASIITPNIPEAAKLLNCQPAINEKQMRQQGRDLLKLGCKAVIMKGGHLLSNTSSDWLITKEYELRYEAIRIATKNTHGTGCALSAALAALRPFYQDWPQTLQAAKSWLHCALLHAEDLNVGKGIGPIHHFYEWW